MFKNRRNIIFKVYGVRIGNYCKGIIANKMGLDLFFITFGKSFTQRRKSKDLEMNFVEHHVLFSSSEKKGVVHKQRWTRQHCSEVLKKLCQQKDSDRSVYQEVEKSNNLWHTPLRRSVCRYCANQLGVIVRLHELVLSYK